MIFKKCNRSAHTRKIKDKYGVTKSIKVRAAKLKKGYGVLKQPKR